MTNTYDYMNFLNEMRGAEAQGTKKANPATAGQVKYYKDLCVQRNMTPQDPNTFDYDTMSAEIKKLLSFYPASKTQLELINTKLVSLKDILNNMHFTEEQLEAFRLNTSNNISVIIAGLIDNNLNVTAITNKLTGGREGTASKLIESLIGIEKQFSDLQMPTEPQIETIVNYFLCAEVPFEDYGISRRIELEEGLWRKPSPLEFANSIKATFNKGSASKFIDDNRGIFYEWKKTRIRPEQMRYIMELERRISNQAPTNEIHQANTLEGDVINVGKTSREYIKGVEYVVHTQEQLVQFSLEQASDFISQLKAELGRREASTFEPEIDIDFMRGTKSIEDAMKKEYEYMLDLMFKFEAVAGYVDEDLHDAIKEGLVTDHSDEEYASNRKKLKEFMRELLVTEAITFNGLLDMARESVTLQHILVDM